MLYSDQGVIFYSEENGLFYFKAKGSQLLKEPSLEGYGVKSSVFKRLIEFFERDGYHIVNRNP